MGHTPSGLIPALSLGIIHMFCSPAPSPGHQSWQVVLPAGQRLLERYGMTETGMILGNPLRGERRPGSVGLPFEGVAVRIETPGGSDAPPGASARGWQRRAAWLPRMLGASAAGHERSPALHSDLPPLRVTPPGEPGELVVKGDQLFAGYWGRPEATAEAFDARGFFRTGERESRAGCLLKGDANPIAAIHPPA